MNKRITAALLTLLLIPVFLVVACPCPHAEAAGQTYIKRLPCKSCCPEMRIASSSGCAVITKLFSLAETIQVGASEVLKFDGLGISHAEQLHSDQSGGGFQASPPGIENPIPLTVLHQVFRI